MGIFKRGDNIYWYRFNWNGVRIRESTKQGNLVRLGRLNQRIEQLWQRGGGHP